MSVVEAVAVALGLAAGLSLMSAAGWWASRKWPADQSHYVTLARLEEALATQQQRHEAAMLGMDRRLAASVARQDVLEAALDGEQEKRRADHARMAEVERLFAAWMSYARQLAEIIRRELGTEPPPEPVAEIPPVRRRPGDGMAGLARKVARQFSLGEMDDLAMELGLTEVVAGGTQEERASSLVMAAERRQMVSRLVEVCREQRPEGGF